MVESSQVETENCIPLIRKTLCSNLRSFQLAYAMMLAGQTRSYVLNCHMHTAELPQSSLKRRRSLQN